MSATYQTRLKRSEAVGEQTASFYFERPAGFEFQAGQHLDLDLGQESSANHEDAIHTFSIASAPFEEDLMITTRLRDSVFKRALKNLSVNAVVSLQGPHGSFTLSENQTRPCVLVAGGVGITPFRSILKEAEHQSRLNDIYLFYANRNLQSAAFLDELSSLNLDAGQFTLVPAMTGLGLSAGDWPGETGRIDSGMLARYLNPAAAAYYVAGPPSMVKATRQLLSQIVTEPGNIRFESFMGYDS